MGCLKICTEWGTQDYFLPNQECWNREMEECTPEFSREKQDIWIEKTREYTQEFCREICPYKIVFSHLEETHKKWTHEFCRE